MGRPLRELTPHVSAQHRFGAELRGLRKLRGFSQTALGRLVMYSGSTVSKIEKAERWPSDEFARRCDEVLGAKGALTASWYIALMERTAPERNGTRAEDTATVRRAGEGPVLDRILRLPTDDRERLRACQYMAGRIVGDLMHLQAVIAEYGDCLGPGDPGIRGRLDEAITLLVGITRIGGTPRPVRAVGCRRRGAWCTDPSG